jgi:hypothetical protein
MMFASTYFIMLFMASMVNLGNLISFIFIIGVVYPQTLLPFRSEFDVSRTCRLVNEVFLSGGGLFALGWWQPQPSWLSPAPALQL